MNVRVAHVPFDRIGVIACRSGSLIEVFLPTYLDIIMTEQQQPAYQKAYMISRVIKVDDRAVNMDEVLKLYWDEAVRILDIIRKHSKV
jgi:hypothetical protein